MQRSAQSRPATRTLPPSLQDSSARIRQTSRNVPMLVSEAEYRRLRSTRQSLARQEPIDRKLIELLDGCD